MNFGDAIIDLMRAIYGNMYSAVTINGAKTKYFQLTRSIRQGDPSAVTWFILAIEPLGNLIRASKTIHPIIIPNQASKRLNMYIDDTTVFTSDARDHDVISEINDTYEKGSGAKFNPEKTEIILLGKWSDNSRSILPSKNIKKNIKLLGVWFGPDAGDLNNSSILAKVDKALEFWRNIKLSFEGKKLIIATKILSQVTHVAKVTGISKTLQQNLQKRITSFFWHPRKMCLVSMATLQNEISDGGLELPNLHVLNKALLTERICKIMKYDPPWKGQLIYRNGFSLRSLDASFATTTYSHTFSQTPMSDIIVSTYRELKDTVTDWSKENFRSLQRKLYVKTDTRVGNRRDFSNTWMQINRATKDRKCRDMCFLIAHDSLPLNAMLTRRHVTKTDACQLCGKYPETPTHLFVECRHVHFIKRILEKLIDPLMARTLSEEEILYHEGRIKMKKKASTLISIYKHSIWICRAKLYYDEIKRKDLHSTLQSLMKQKIDRAKL